tara:strand:+ start:119 stop:571 length:453 start_codon:yes stop_codon:yes gene_type:complete
MNIKNKLITFFIFFTILTLSILNIKNTEKTNFYFFTSKLDEISLGNLITVTFISGFTLSSLLTLLAKNNLQRSFEDNFVNDEEIDKSEEINFRKEMESDRPPERDVRESQPTISVNYRFVDQDKNYYGSKKTINDLNNENNDWNNNENGW